MGSGLKIFSRRQTRVPIMARADALSLHEAICLHSEIGVGRPQSEGGVLQKTPAGLERKRYVTTFYDNWQQNRADNCVEQGPAEARLE